MGPAVDGMPCAERLFGAIGLRTARPVSQNRIVESLTPRCDMGVTVYFRESAEILQAIQAESASEPFNLNYDEWIHLDAEDLAEQGIGRAYESLLPALRQYVPQPARIDEVIDDDTLRYSVRYGGREFPVSGPELDEESGNSWGRATYAFFAIVNSQLADSSHRFYAINGGNDLGGMFLTPAQAEAATKTLPEKRDWPYLPKDEAPWYGQPH